MEATKQRPLGITILAVLAFISGALSILGGVAALGLGGFGIAAGEATGGTLVIVLGLVSIVVGIVSLAFGYGAWTLQPWAWTLGVILEGITIVLALVNGFLGSSWTSQISSIVIAGIILYYLFTPGVRAAFGKS
jgi:hypothetical protein